MPITLFINSGGGLVHSGLAIFDAMSSITPRVETVAYGRCFSIAALLLAAGERGHRSAYKNTRLMVHEPSCSYPKLQTADLIIKVAELENTRRTLEEALSDRTGRPECEISERIGRDMYMSANEAREFGIIDRIHAPPPSTPVAEEVS